MTQHRVVPLDFLLNVCRDQEETERSHAVSPSPVEDTNPLVDDPINLDNPDPVDDRNFFEHQNSTGHQRDFGELPLTLDVNFFEPHLLGNLTPEDVSPLEASVFDWSSSESESSDTDTDTDTETIPDLSPEPPKVDVNSDPVSPVSDRPGTLNSFTDPCEDFHEPIFVTGTFSFQFSIPNVIPRVQISGNGVISVMCARFSSNE